MAWSARAGVVFSVAVGAAVLGGAALPLTDHPKFRASCHTITPSHESWITSSHTEVTCVACHARPGIEGRGHDNAWVGALPDKMVQSWFDSRRKSVPCCGYPDD